jgi:hypothetical protein
MRYRLTEEQGAKIATEFIANGYKGTLEYELETPRRDRMRPGEWTVVVRWLGEAGSTIDGPSIVLVNDLTGEARYF